MPRYFFAENGCFGGGYSASHNVDATQLSQNDELFCASVSFLTQLMFARSIPKELAVDTQKYWTPRHLALSNWIFFLLAASWAECNVRLSRSPLEGRI